MLIPLDGINLETDGFVLAEQAFDGLARVDEDGEVDSIIVHGLKKIARGIVERRTFDLPRTSPLFAILSAAVTRQYAERIREWRDLPKQRPFTDQHRSNVLEEVA